MGGAEEMEIEVSQQQSEKNTFPLIVIGFDFTNKTIVCVIFSQIWIM